MYFVYVIKHCFFSLSQLKLSALNHHITGLTPGERIYALCNCAVKDFDSWKACLQEMEEKPRGLCVPKHLLYNNSGNIYIFHFIN